MIQLKWVDGSFYLLGLEKGCNYLHEKRVNDCVKRKVGATFLARKKLTGQ